MQIPIVPDKLFKFLIMVGLLIIIPTIVILYNKQEDLNSKILNYNVQIKKEQIQISDYNRKLKELNVLLDSAETKGEVCSKVQDKIIEITDIKNKINTLEESLELNQFELELFIKESDDIFIVFKEIMCFAAVFIFIGIVLWIIEENKNESYKLRELTKLPLASKECQSCGLRFNSIVKYGTEINGDKNYCFCENCFLNGQFIENDITLKEMKAKIEKHYKTKGKCFLYVFHKKKLLKYLDRWN